MKKWTFGCTTFRFFPASLQCWDMSLTTRYECSVASRFIDEFHLTRMEGNSRCVRSDSVSSCFSLPLKNKQTDFYARCNLVELQFKCYQFTCVWLYQELFRLILSDTWPCFEYNYNSVCMCVLYVCVPISPGYGDTLCVAVLRADGFFQLIQLPRLLQLLHQALDSFFTPFLLLSASILLPDSSDATSCSSASCRSLLPPQQPLHHRGSEG